jgi:leucyl aminopeptidase
MSLIMKLYTTDSIQDKDNLVLLGSAKSDFSSFLSSASEGDFIRERAKNEKDITVINQYSRTIFVIILKEEEVSGQQLEAARKAAYKLHSILNDLEVTALKVQSVGVSNDQVLSFAEGLALSNYQFNKYHTKKDNKSFLVKELGLLADGLKADKVQKLSSLINAVGFSRDLVNEPLSYLTAEKLSEEIAKAGKEAGYSTEIFNKKKIESLKMGGLLAVNKGSIDPPTFTILEWKPENAVNKKPYVLVGKGVVYDTGGLSLKPTNDSMDYMKCDMGGAAAVAGSFSAIAASKLPVWVIGLIPATDNRPDGNAYVPGDVVVMHDGSTVEVLNTDAEGRMILADALSYAKQYDPELVIELSTLTGAAHAAIGHYGIVGMGNASSKVMDTLKASGENTFERIAEFPFWDEYSEMLKSDIADMKNIGGKVGGAITAGKFLEKFTAYPYIHLDIAGPSYNKVEDSYRGKGGTGVGVRLLFDYFDQLTH